MKNIESQNLMADEEFFFFSENNFDFICVCAAESKTH